MISSRKIDNWDKAVEYQINASMNKIWSAAFILLSLFLTLSMFIDNGLIKQLSVEADVPI